MIFYQLSRSAFFTGLFLLPLLFVPGAINGFEGTKVWFFQWWVLVLAIVSSKNQINKSLFVLVFIYFFWNLFTSLRGVDPINSFWGLFWRGQGLITLGGYTALVLAVGNIARKSDSKQLAQVLIASGFSVCIFVLVTLAGNELFDWPVYRYLDRLVGTMGNPNFLGGFLAICFPLIFVSKNWLIRIILSCVFLLTIYLSGSRGAFLALGAGFGFFVWLNIFKKSRASGILMAISAGLGFCLWFFPWVNKIPWTDPNFAASRQRMWVRGYRAFVKRPIMGYGLENYSIAVVKIVYPGGLSPEGEVYADKAHNETLEILVASGLPGLILWAAIVLFAARKYYIKNNYLFLTALLVFLVKAQTNVVSVSEYGLFWILVGFSAVDN